MSTFKSSFVSLGLNKDLISVLEDYGYKEPLPVQKKCIPYLLNGHDVLSMAYTGSGKTAAFILPLLQNLNMNIESVFVQGLIVAPTRELVIQIGQVCKDFAKYNQHITIAVLYGGQNYNSQFRVLKKNPHIVIGTPGRLLDHLKRGTVNISKLKTLIIDEADEMLRMGFLEDIERIITQVPIKRQTALFSATLPGSIRRIGYRFMNNPKEVCINPNTNMSSEIKQYYWMVKGIEKYDGLIRFLEIENFEAAIVFVRTKDTTLKIAEILKKHGYNSAALNGDMNQIIRNQTISRLRCGGLDVLISTDVAARGLDISRISLVINYDVPSNYDDYIHRIGRTGRSGRTGKSLLFIGSREYRFLDNVKKRLNFNISKIQYPTLKVLMNHRVVRFIDKIAYIARSEDTEKYKSLFDQIKSNKNINMNVEDLSAILLKMAEGNRPLVLPPDPIPVKTHKSAYLNKQSFIKKHVVMLNKQNQQLDSGFFVRNRNKNKRFQKGSNVQWYHIAMGLNDGINARHITGAVKSKINKDIYSIANVRLFSSYSMIAVSCNSAVHKKITDPVLFKIRIFNKSVNVQFLGRFDS